MSTSKDRQVHERAYHLWVEGGRLEGRSEEYWHRAEREVYGSGPTEDVKPVPRGTTSETVAAPDTAPEPAAGKARPAARSKTPAKAANAPAKSEPVAAATPAPKARKAAAQ